MSKYKMDQGANSDSRKCESVLKPIVFDEVEIPLSILGEKSRKLYYLADIYHQDAGLSVLIEGETGTGKELLAKTIHYGLGTDYRKKDNFVAINCAAISPGLFESELFGYEAGAFTGGLARGQLGKIDLAHQGTLFFDEVSELPLELQGKLLRVLQEREYYRVGGLKRIRFEARVICATNVNLTERMQKGSFRRDLYYRLNVAQMVIPPLRERREEIIPLAYYFLHKYNKLKDKKILEIEASAERILSAYNWPGNVRELQNIMNHLTTRYRNELKIKSKHILEIYPALMHNKGQPDLNENGRQPSAPIKPLKEYINEFILQILKKNAGNKSLTAKQLGISRHVLYNYLQKMEQK